MTKYEQADKAIKAYDAFIFSGFGRPFDSGRASLLALDAAEACAAASRDRTVNQTTRNTYCALREQFAALAY